MNHIYIYILHTCSAHMYTCSWFHIGVRVWDCRPLIPTVDHQAEPHSIPSCDSDTRLAFPIPTLTLKDLQRWQLSQPSLALCFIVLSQRAVKWHYHFRQLNWPLLIQMITLVLIMWHKAYTGAALCRAGRHLAAGGRTKTAGKLSQVRHDAASVPLDAREPRGALGTLYEHFRNTVWAM